MGLQRDGGDLSQSLHLIEHEGHDREVEPPGGRVEKEGYSVLRSEADMEFELGEINSDDRFRSFFHVLIPNVTAPGYTL